MVWSHASSQSNLDRDGEEKGLISAIWKTRLTIEVTEPITLFNFLTTSLISMTEFILPTVTLILFRNFKTLLAKFNPTILLYFKLKY